VRNETKDVKVFNQVTRTIKNRDEQRNTVSGRIHLADASPALTLDLESRSRSRHLDLDI